jgi:hypothetical protein
VSFDTAMALAFARRYGPAAAGAALINAALIAIVVFSEPRQVPPQAPAFQVSLVTEVRPAKNAHAERPVAHAPAPRIVASASRAAQPAPPPPLPVPPTKWTADLSSPAAVRDVPSVQKSVLDRDACAKGELWKLSTEAKAKCLDRWGRFKPSEEARLHPPQLRDPHGDFARAVAAAEAQRRSFQDAPMGVCDPASTGSNFGGAGCHSSGKGSLVQRLEGEPPH